jgi:hypothetical protein
VVPLENYEGSSCLSDSNGRLLFFSDGIHIYNSGNIRQNLNTLPAHSSSIQPVSLIDAHNSLFVSTTNPSNGFYLQKYLRDNDSLIFLYSKKLLTSSSEGQSTVLHQNKRHQWLTTQVPNSSKIYSFLFQDTSLVCCPVVERNATKISERYSQVKFSPQGNILGVSSTYDNYVTLSKFNSENATISNHQTIGCSQPYSFEFSTKTQHWKKVAITQSADYQ